MLSDQTDAVIRVRRSPSGRGYRLESEQRLACPRDQVFNFFSDPQQLERLTPSWLRFELLTAVPIPMAVGTPIDYRLRLHGVPVRWRRRISVWEPPLRFVDEQTRGPYRWWRHEHRFEADGDQTISHDSVDYTVLGGAIIHRLFVRRDLLKIFRFRQRVLEEVFCTERGPEQTT